MDLTAVSAAPVSGRAASPVAITPGPATLSGTVFGPNGPIGGANIHVERLVGNSKASLDVTSQPDGSWNLAGILGGQYRLRAWRGPDLALTTPQVFFLGTRDNKSITLQLSAFTGINVATAIAPDPPVVGERANLVIQVSTQSVDNQGVVRSQPMPAANVQLANGLAWSVGDPNPTTTDSNGAAAWQVICGNPGQQALAVVVNGTDTLPLRLPPCDTAPVPLTTTSTTQAPSTTSTSTTRRSTTTTTFRLLP
jgi:hypothetical protein